jgi:hypothetical protein
MTVILGNAYCKRTYFLLLTLELLQVMCVRTDGNQLPFLYTKLFLIAWCVLFFIYFFGNPSLFCNL